MSRGKSLPYYGKIGVATLNSEVKSIWYSRHIELELCEPVDTYWPICTDPELLLRQDFARRLIEITPLTEVEEQAVVLLVLDNCTLQEAGKEMNKSTERVRQILMKAMRKFRTCQIKLTGMNLWELDTRDMSYSWWRHEQRKSK